MVNHIVVTVINTSAVRTFFKVFYKTFHCFIRCNYINRPVEVAVFGFCNICIVHIVRAGFKVRTVFVTALCCTFWGKLGLVVFKAAKAAYCLAVLTCKPQINIHIVTAFLQYHRAGFGGIAPVAANKTVCLVPVKHIFDSVNGHYFTDCTAVDNFLHFSVERCVSQNMAHHNVKPFFVGKVCNFDAFVKLGGNWFFQQQMISFFQSRHCVTVVLTVHCGNNHNISHPVSLQHLLGAVKLHFGSYAVFFAEHCQLFRDDICRSSKFNSVFKVFQGFGICVAAAAQTCKCNFQFGHRFVSFPA